MAQAAPTGDCTGCEAQGHSQGRAREDGPGEVTPKGEPEECLVVGCRLGEILFCTERSQKRTCGLGELPAGPHPSESRGESGGRRGARRGSGSI